jgi:hypothetical protein
MLRVIDGVPGFSSQPSGNFSRPCVNIKEVPLNSATKGSLTPRSRTSCDALLASGSILDGMLHAH